MTGGLAKLAYVYRVVTPQHTCRYGLKSVELLREQGFLVEEHILASRSDEDDFKAKHQVKTTPQTFIDGKRIGGYNDVRRHLGQTALNFDAICERPPFFALGVIVCLTLGAVWFIRAVSG